MVILLVSILAAVSLPQFINYGTEAKDAATKSALGSLRTAINNQYLNMTLRCGTSGTYPTLAQLNANDITTGGTPCTTAMIPTATNRQFVMGGTLPDNPWGGGATKNVAVACSGAGTGCNQTDATNCAGNAYTAADTGWCYNPATGKIWANSNNSPSTPKEYNF